MYVRACGYSNAGLLSYSLVSIAFFQPVLVRMHMTVRGSTQHRFRNLSFVLCSGPLDEERHGVKQYDQKVCDRAARSSVRKDRVYSVKFDVS